MTNTDNLPNPFDPSLYPPVTAWVTAAVTPLPAGWLHVFVMPTLSDEGAWFYTTPCPATLLQKRRAGADRETRVVAAQLVRESLVPVTDNPWGQRHGALYYSTMTVDEWEPQRADAEQQMTADHDRAREVALGLLYELQGTPLHDEDLLPAVVDAGVPFPAARAALASLKRDGLIERCPAEGGEGW